MVSEIGEVEEKVILFDEKSEKEVMSKQTEYYKG